MNIFDQKFGSDFLSTVPVDPGIYRIYDNNSRLIYVGKAKNLKRRLGQYRNAKRRKKHKKMRKIIDDADAIQLEICATELEAELLEARMIQLHRPKWNVAGAFYFLYPMIGLRWEQNSAYFCYTTQPEDMSIFSFHGAYRSRQITLEAFFAMTKLLKFIGHPIPKSAYPFEATPRYSYVYGFRQLPCDWRKAWSDFFEGSSKLILEELILALVENAKARKSGQEVQEHLNKLLRFWNHESSVLSKARSQTGYSVYPVAQTERDLLFLKYRHHRNGLVGGSQKMEL